ncbi:hypothetical protein F0562_026795 [Nyssa sinensis]|uniref:Peroxidase n=1 Tax=Nyssa sinensis TaxID=561372 RepID=A0A5J5BAC7_9ASTE|nr:hypothetical protein F0562_026795 [Nyssa sinensis]
MVLSIVLFLVLYMSYQMEAQQLKVGFYGNTCRVAESIVKEEVQKAFAKDEGIAPGLGCDASVLIDSTPNNAAEKDGPPNGFTLRGLEVIDNAKARLEAECRGVVSCADILAFAARDAVVITRGFGWDVPAGRRDGRVSHAEDTVDIPAPFFDLDQVTRAFTKKGLTQEDMVTLSGAHTIGRAHCSSFSNRLYNFSPKDTQDPSLSFLYAEQLKQQCPRGTQGSIDPDLVVSMNFSPDLMDHSYYADVLANRGLFTSDQALTTSSATAEQARLYALNGLIWQSDFAQAMVKLSQIEVLTGTAGEIRANCRVVNA